MAAYLSLQLYREPSRSLASLVDVLVQWTWGYYDAKTVLKHLVRTCTQRHEEKGPNHFAHQDQTIPGHTWRRRTDSRNIVTQHHDFYNTKLRWSLTLGPRGVLLGTVPVRGYVLKTLAMAITQREDKISDFLQQLLVVDSQRLPSCVAIPSAIHNLSILHRRTHTPDDRECIPRPPTQTHTKKGESISFSKAHNLSPPSPPKGVSRCAFLYKTKLFNIISSIILRLTCVICLLSWFPLKSVTLSGNLTFSAINSVTVSTELYPLST